MDISGHAKQVDILDLHCAVSVKATGMATFELWFWRVAIWGMVILFLIPISLWYFWGFSVVIFARKDLALLHILQTT